MTNKDDTFEIIVNEQLLTFFSEIFCPNINQNVIDWKEKILNKSPDLEPYLVRRYDNNFNINSKQIKLTYDESKPAAKSLFPVPIEMIHETIVGSIMSICALGGGKVLVDILKAWVEARKSRVIEIKKGDVTLKIQGFVSEKDIKTMYDIFNKEALTSNIIKP